MEKFSKTERRKGVVRDREAEGKCKKGDLEAGQSKAVLRSLCSSTDEHQTARLIPELPQVRLPSTYWLLTTPVVTLLRAVTLFKAAPQRVSLFVLFTSLWFECVPGLYPACLADGLLAV